VLAPFDAVWLRRQERQTSPQGGMAS
jgi:hypothetical protein